MKVAIATGGTGGHIYPAITVADTIKSRIKDVDIYFIGRVNDKAIIERAGYKFCPINIYKLPKNITKELFFLPFELLFSIINAMVVLRKNRTNFALGFGGFASFPTIIAASLLSISTAIHEQNSIPGVSNRILSKFAKRTFISFPTSAKYFPEGKTTYAGFPIRFSESSLISKESARLKLGLDPSKKTVLVFGGSQGSKIVNDMIIDMIPSLIERKDIQVIIITGNLNYQKFMNELKSKYQNVDSDIKVLSYLHEMEYAYRSADIAICRAGAATLFELHFFSIPAILIPLKIAAADHQMVNAMFYSSYGTSEIIDENSVTSSFVFNRLVSIIDNFEKLEEMGKAYEKVHFQNAREVIVKEIEKIYYG